MSYLCPLLITITDKSNIYIEEEAQKNKHNQNYKN